MLREKATGKGPVLMSIAASRKKAIVLGGAMAVCLLAILLALMASGSTKATGETVVEAPPSSVAPTFEVLERRLDVEALPDVVRSSLDTVMSRKAQESAEVGVADLPRGGVATVLGNSRGVCLSTINIGEGGAGCGSAEEAVLGKIVLASVCEPGVPDGDIRLVGLAPNGVTAVGFDSAANGTVDKTVEVDSNVYEAVVEPTETVILGVRGQGGPVKVTLPLHVAGLQQGESCAP